MALDTDIATAPDALTLDKIRAQEYRRSVTQQANTTQFIATEGAKLLDPDQEIRKAIVEAIAVNYMKPTTGTLPDTIAADTANDAARLRSAVAAVLDIIKNG